MRHPLGRTNPVNGRKTLFLGATPFDITRHKRLMQRTTVRGDLPESISA